MPSGIRKWVYRQISQSCCPWNIRFAQELTEPAFAPRDVLTHALDDPEPLVREHAAWALERIGSPAAVEVLRTRLREEPDDSVCAALRGEPFSVRLPGYLYGAVGARP